MTTGTRTTSHDRPSSRRGRLTAVVAGAALTLGVAAPVPTASAAAPGSIAGTVTDDSGAPLGGITVRVYDLDPFVGDVVVAEGVTDAVTGDYLVEGIEADPYYRVQFSDPDGEWATEYYDDSIAATVGAGPFAQWVPVADGATTEDIDASLEVGGSISGRLTRPNGTPVSSGEVSLFWQYADRAWARAGTFSTDADGRYSIPGVRAATYGIQFRDLVTGATEAWNDRPDITSSTPLVVASGSDLTGIDAVMGGIVTNVTAPTITGTAQVGQTLTVSSGWQPSDTTVTYRWVVGDDTSPGDDPRGTTYVPTAADVGRTIRVEATGTRGAGWTPATAWSAPTGPVAAAPVPAVVNERLPRIKGTLRVGRIVRVTVGEWTPYPKRLKFRWFAAGKPVKGATHQRLKLTKKQAGKRLRVVVTASAPKHEPLAVTTKRTGKVRR